MKRSRVQDIVRKIEETFGNGAFLPVKRDFRRPPIPPFRLSGGRLGHVPSLRRSNDPGGIRRQALASVRGRRVGRQRHASFCKIPGCRSSKCARPQEGGRRTRPSARIIGEPLPGKGTPVNATFVRRGSFLLFSLTAGRTQPRLCHLERHRRVRTTRAQTTTEPVQRTKSRAIIRIVGCAPDPSPARAAVRVPPRRRCEE